MQNLQVLLTFMLLFLENQASTQMCSMRKSENSCFCKRVSGAARNSVVTEADCTRINAESVPSQEELTQDLNLLDVSHNNIEKLDESAKKLSSVTLETLILSYNRISDISDGFFREVPNLRKLVLSHNNITSLEGDQLFANCEKLTELDLSYNQIKAVHVELFSPMLQLQVIDLSYNDQSLGDWLTQSSNFLSILNLHPNITTVKLDKLGLQDLHNLYFVNYTNLKHLSLADNHFQQVPSVPYTVEYLDLSGSDISVLQAKHLSYHSLKTLRLERMKKLESIHPYAFYNLQALEELSIRNCFNLKEFNELIFGVLHKNMAFSLKRLTLAGNALESLNSTYKYLFRMLDYADLTDNPWRCNCDLLWLQEFDNLYRSEYLKCSSPPLLSSKALIDITDKDVPLCYPQKYGKKSHRILITFLCLAVLLLSALVAYLIYYSPRLYGGSRRIGPQSPYNAAQAEEDRFSFNN